MRFTILLYFLLLNFTYSFSQITNYPYIDIDFEGVEEITIGDKVFLQGDPNEYTMVSVGKSYIPLHKMGRQQEYCMCKTEESIKYLNQFKSNFYCDKKGFFSRIKSKLESVEESDYWERVARYPLNSIITFEKEGKTMLGVISFVSPFSDQLEVSVANKWGIPEKYIINADQLKKNSAVKILSPTDSLQYIYASLSWNSTLPIFYDEYPNLGKVRLQNGNQLVLHKPDGKSLYTNEWHALQSRYRRHGDYRTNKYRDFLKSFWKYENGILKIWEVGNMAEVLLEDAESDQIEKENIYELVLELRVDEITSNSVTYTLERSQCLTYLAKEKSAYNYSPKYTFDSIYITPYKDQVIHFGDVVTLKNDPNTYFITDVGYRTTLTKVDKNQTESIQIEDFAEKLDKVVAYNYKGIVDIKNRYPIHSKIDLGGSNIGYVKGIDYFKNEIEYVHYAESGSKNKRIGIENALPVKPNSILPSDTIARIMDTQDWRTNSRLFEYHSWESGRILISIGDTITYTALDYKGLFGDVFERRKKNRKKRKGLDKDVGEVIRLMYNTSELDFSGFDISNRSKANLEMKGTWKLEKDIVTYTFLGHSMTWAPLYEDRSNNLKANNKWKHILRFKIIDIGDLHISYQLIDKKSELIYSLPASHLK